MSRQQREALKEIGASFVCTTIGALMIAALFVAATGGP